jgi:thiamine biosynthesis lipoprotein
VLTVGRTRTMSCPATVSVAGDPALVGRAVDRLHDLERRWSRFLPSSEISRLNAAAGAPCRVSADTIHLVEALVRAWHLTDGAFDPTLLGALVGLGYAASRDDAEVRTSLPAGARWQGDPAGVLVDRDAGVVVVPRGTVLDPGGLGKGLAADLVVGELLDAGAHGALVEVGGDLRAGGEPPDGWAWTVDVAGPRREPLARLALAAGGVATSSTRFRRWAGPDGERHHLVDPTTLRSCDTTVVSCTVVAGTAAWSEAFTKVAFVRGRWAAAELHERHGLAALVVTEDGARHPSPAWSRFEQHEETT